MGNTSRDTAKGIHHALKLFKQSTGSQLTIRVTVTDAGGGGVSVPLVVGLEDIGQVTNNKDYTYSTCVLHGMNLLLKYPIEEVFGLGGLKKRTFLQMLHTSYNLWQQY